MPDFFCGTERTRKKRSADNLLSHVIKPKDFRLCPHPVPNNLKSFFLFTYIFFQFGYPFLKEGILFHKEWRESALIKVIQVAAQLMSLEFYVNLCCVSQSMAATAQKGESL
jgi:hypothetical protein